MASSPDGPTDLFSQQRANRRRSFWLVTLFVAFFLWLGLGGDWLAWKYTHTPPYPARNYHHELPLLGALMALIGAGIVIYIKKTGAEKVLWSSGAVPVIDPPTEDQKMFVNVVEEMSIAAGIPKPKLYVIEDDDPNAFATGLTPLKSYIAVTSGLLRTCNRDELQAVIGHEMGHIKNQDMELMTLVAGLVGAVALISDGVGRTFIYGDRRGGSKSKDLGPVFFIVLVLWLISWLLAPIITRLMAVAISRRREYLADAMSAQFTRNPLALASALQKIEAADAPTKSIKGGVAHLCIADPLGRHLSSKEGAIADLLATHPPMALRIARLKAMGYQAQKAAGNFQPS